LNVDKKIGDRIRLFRVMRDLSQDNVADEIGMSAGNFGKIERGEIDISTSHLVQIAKVLKVNVIEFFEDKLTLAEKENTYGFATKDELENLSRQMQSLIRKEFEKLRQELPVKRTASKKYIKSKKAGKK
jgi:transcriptional regulator with XRE-family HTH domain